MNKSIIFTSVSKAGGVGKTTLAVNIAHQWSLRGFSVGIIDLDSNHSIEEFVGLSPESDPSKTSLAMFADDFDGSYPFVSILNTNNVFLLQGHDNIEFLPEELHKKRRREYILQNIFEKYPPQYDLIIIDLPGGFDIVTENVISASSHILLPVDIGVKAMSSSDLIQKLFQTFEELKLEPTPQIIGLLPNKYDKGSASDNVFLSSLNEIASYLDIKAYSPIRYWKSLKRSASEGKALSQIRSTDPMVSVFSNVVDDLVKVRQNA